MKKLVITLSLIVSFQIVFGQKTLSKIDSTNSKEEIEKFIHSLDKRKLYEDFVLQGINEFENHGFHNHEYCKKIADSLNITESIYKTDFDNNGLTDLLAIGLEGFDDFCILVVMNYGQGSFKINILTRRFFQKCTFPKIVNDTIKYYYLSEPDDRITKEKPTLQRKDLIFKFGDFIEYNPKPKTYEIEKIEYQTSECFGVCPQFNIQINRDRKGIYKAEHNNRRKVRRGKSKEIKGTFKTLIKEDSYLKIIDVLNYIDFPSLNYDYAVNWSDAQTCVLKITYNNGQTKEIKDYGLIGSYGLEILYNLFFELRHNQKWK